jgi:hypothetical protein
MDAPSVELCDERECEQLEAFLVERIHEFNAHATGYFDGKLIGGRLRRAGDVTGHETNAARARREAGTAAAHHRSKPLTRPEEERSCHRISMSS